MDHTVHTGKAAQALAAVLCTHFTLCALGETKDKSIARYEGLILFKPSGVTLATGEVGQLAS